MELDWLKKWNQYSPNSLALTDGDSGRSVTYSDLFLLSQKGAQVLFKKWNIKPNDRVAVLCSNQLEYIILFFSLNRLGASLVPINTRLKAPEIEHILQDCQSQLLVYDDELLSTVESLLASRLEKVHIKSWFEHLQNEKELFSDFLATKDSLAFILYTSGTTGSPKGAMITFTNIFWNSLNTTLRLDISQKDRAVIFLPLFHTGGWNVLTTPFFHRGAENILIKKFEASKVLKLTIEKKCTLLFGVPTTMDMMTRCPSFSVSDFKHLRYAIVGGEPMPTHLIEIWHEKGVPIRQGYGLTEFGPNVFSLNQEDAIRKKGSIGFPNFYIEARILNEKKEDCPIGEIGELALKGPVAMKGYWNNPKASAEAFHNEWLLTGDLVKQDADGFFYVMGRKKEMFISGGENVYPAEVEETLRKVPGIQEIAVVGVPDERWGEVGKAFIVSDQNPSVLLQDLKIFSEKNLAKFKTPKYYEFLEVLPKSESGKILKRMLQA